MGDGPLTKRFHLTSVNRKDAKKKVAEARKDLETRGPGILGNDALNDFRMLLGDTETMLKEKRSGDDQKRKDVKITDERIDKIQKALSSATDIKKPAIDKYNKEYKRLDDTIFKPLREAVAKSAPDSTYSSEAENKFGMCQIGFMSDLRSNAIDSKSAMKICDDHIKKLNTVAEEGKKIDVKAFAKNASDLAAAQKTMEAMSPGILRLETVSYKQLPEIVKQQAECFKLISDGKGAEAVTASSLLKNKVDTAIEDNRKSAEAALKKVRADAKKLREDWTKVSGEKGKLEPLKKVFETIGGRIDILDAFLEGNETPQTVPACEKIVGDIRKLLDEVAKFGPKEAEEFKKQKEKIKSALADKKKLFFKSDAAKFYPKELADLQAKQEDLEKEIDGMGIAEAQEMMKSLETEADNLTKKTETAKSTLENLEKDSKAFGKEKDALDKIIKNDKFVDEKSMHGGVIDLIAGFKGALSATPPNLPQAAKLKSEIENGLAALKDGGTYHVARVVRSHRQSLEAEAKLKKLKEEWQKFVELAEERIEAAETAVDKANPGDEMEKKAIRASFKEIKKTGDASKDEKGIQGAIDRMHICMDRAIALAKNPQGEAAHARDELGKLKKSWSDRVNAFQSDINKISTEVKAAENIDDEVKKKVDSLLTGLTKRFNGKAFDPVIDQMVNGASKDNAGPRKKAREEGLRLLREYRDVITKDQVANSLIVQKPFKGAPFTPLNQALNDLELNLLRGV